MLLEKIVIHRTKQDGSPSQRYDVWYEFSCDACSSVYRRRPRDCTSARLSKTGLTFCSNACKGRSRERGNKLCETTSRTCLERYGATSASTNEAVKAKRVATLLERYGVSSPMNVPEFKEKRRRALVEHYGVPETFQANEPLKKREATWRAKYNQGCPPQAVEAAKRAIETQPIKWSSKAEVRFRDFLREHFSEVKHQKWINGWPIDFYIPSIDTYVQFDGVYWHGLDRPIEVIRSSTKVHDRAIVAKWETDREQDMWFARSGIRLVRVTDVEFKTAVRTTVLDAIRGRTSDRSSDGQALRTLLDPTCVSRE